MHCRLKYSQQIGDSWLNRHLQLFQVASSDPIFIVSSLENQNKVDLKVFKQVGWWWWRGGGGIYRQKATDEKATSSFLVSCLLAFNLKVKLAA